MKIFPFSEENICFIAIVPVVRDNDLLDVDFSLGQLGQPMTFAEMHPTSVRPTPSMGSISLFTWRLKMWFLILLFLVLL